MSDRKDFLSVLYTWYGPDRKGAYFISAVAKLYHGPGRELQRFRSGICNQSTCHAESKLMEAIRVHYQLDEGDSLEGHFVVIEHTVQVQYKWQLQ